jgi:hypothetical protein
MTIIPCPPYFSLLPKLETKLKGCHFDIIEVIETEPQTVMNTLTEHGFQGEFKKGEALGTVHMHGRGLL